MRSFIAVASLIALASAASVQEFAPKFSIISDRTENGSPSVTVSFADGYTDTLVLNRYFANDEDRMANIEKCHFVGHLAAEKTACVAMTGCPGEDIDFTIMSSHATKSSMFKWHAKDNIVEVIESPFKNAKSEHINIMRNDDGEWVQNGDEIENEDVDQAEMEIAALCTGSTCGAPATGLLQIRAGYDDGFRTKVGGDAQAKAYIEASLPHVQASYCHASLGSKLVIQRIGDIKYYQGRSLQATGAKLQEMWDTTAAELQGADLMMYMGYEESYYGTVGIAWGKVVCIHPSANKYKESINEWRNTHAEAGHVIAHEIGHNIGMDHDFTETHKAAGCNGQGIMSYGNPPNQWSHCSKSDFVAHYMTQKNNWCMDEAPSACDGSTTTFTTTTSTTTTASPCIQSWIQDGFCDDANNVSGCQYDGGDCCNNSRPGWNMYCKDCSCKQAAGK